MFAQFIAAAIVVVLATTLVIVLQPTLKKFTVALMKFSMEHPGAMRIILFIEIVGIVLTVVLLRK